MMGDSVERSQEEEDRRQRKIKLACAISEDGRQLEPVAEVPPCASNRRVGDVHEETGY